jgi:hypothetical protein
MKRPYHLLIPAVFAFYSCHNSSPAVQLINGPRFSLNKGKGDNANFDNPANDPGAGMGGAAQPTALAGFNLASASKKIEPEVIVEELPKSYKQRRFLNDVSSISYDLFMIPGNIITFHPKDTTYEFRTPRAITKGNKPPVVTSIGGDGALYSAKINSNTSFNGSYLIGGLNVNRDEIMEISIQDVAISTVPDSLVDVDAIKATIAGLSDDEKKDLYYIKAATLTYIENRKYTEAKFDASINSCFVTTGGKTYSSNEKFKREKTVSLFLIPLAHLLSTPH